MSIHKLAARGQKMPLAGRCVAGRLRSVADLAVMWLRSCHRRFALVCSSRTVTLGDRLPHAGRQAEEDGADESRTARSKAWGSPRANM